jgi:hypothetical protein
MKCIKFNGRKINRKRLPLKVWQKEVSIFIKQVRDTELQKKEKDFFLWDAF